MGLTYLGHLDRCDTNSEGLDLRGWVVPIGGRPVESFRVLVGDTELPIRELEWLDSPDVTVHVAKKLGPAHGLATDHARFRVTTPPPGGGTHPIVRLQPRRHDELGRSLLLIRSSDLEALAEDDASNVGGSVAVGAEFLSYFIDLCQLQPDAAVLDVGCGVGRMAWALAHYLSPEGKYRGFDIVVPLIERARDVICGNRANFEFTHVDLYNHLYNPDGVLRAVDFEFPYATGEFGFAFLTSVLTHIGTAELRHYADELARVVRPGGTLLATAFLLDEESTALIDAGKSTHDIRHPRDESCFTEDPENPEGAVGHVQESLLATFQARAFIVEQLHPGSWCGRESYLSYQDVIIFRRSTGA